jgi:uridine monophosphate synthetase
MENLKNIIISKLFMIDAIKSDETTNLYFDMRIILSYPNIYKLLFDYALLKYPDLFQNIDRVSGVEFGGIPFSNYISQRANIPQIHIRNTVKDNGLQREIEGVYQNTDNLLLVEDVITTGNTVLEKIKQANDHINISKILVLVDRRVDIIQLKTLFTYPLYTLFTLKDITDYVNKNNINSYFSNEKSNLIYNLAIEKKTNIILSCDLDKTEDILNLINICGNYILGVKLHINIITDFSFEFIKKLKVLKYLYNLIIIEDGKFADNGTIVVKQLDGFFKIHTWTDFITVHSINDVEMIKLINEKYPNLGIILDGKDKIKNNCNQISGLITQDKYIDNYDILTFSSENNMGMFWIIGNDIYQNSQDKISDICQKYSKIGWEYFKNF